MIIDFGTARELKRQVLKIRLVSERRDMQRPNSTAGMGRRTPVLIFIRWCDDVPFADGT